MKQYIVNSKHFLSVIIAALYLPPLHLSGIAKYLTSINPKWFSFMQFQVNLSAPTLLRSMPSLQPLGLFLKGHQRLNVFNKKIVRSKNWNKLTWHCSTQVWVCVYLCLCMRNLKHGCWQVDGWAPISSETGCGIARLPRWDKNRLSQR